MKSIPVALIPAAQPSSRTIGRGRALGVAVLALALAGLAGGCASTTSIGSFKGDAHGVAQTISDLQNDATAADKQKICSRDFSSAVVARLSASGGTCAKALSSQLDQIDNFNLTVQAVKVNGTSATATVKSIRSGKNKLETVQLVKEGSRWKVSSLG